MTSEMAIPLNFTVREILSFLEFLRLFDIDNTLSKKFLPISNIMMNLKSLQHLEMSLKELGIIFSFFKSKKMLEL